MNALVKCFIFKTKISFKVNLVSQPIVPLMVLIDPKKVKMQGKASISLK